MCRGFMLSTFGGLAARISDSSRACPDQAKVSGPDGVLANCGKSAAPRSCWPTEMCTWDAACQRRSASMAWLGRDITRRPLQQAQTVSALPDGYIVERRRAWAPTPVGASTLDGQQRFLGEHGSTGRIVENSARPGSVVRLFHPFDQANMGGADFRSHLQARSCCWTPAGSVRPCAGSSSE